MQVHKIREAFLAYFSAHQHSVVPSSSLVPDDPTLLFTNAGMVPFKQVFLGQEQRDYTRAASSQCCIRAGGKHNDLENVGYTARHHTFFEMLGNFSFGDYFKREAIELAWNFLTQELKLSAEKLWITVYHEDDEAADIWLNHIGVSKERFSRCGEKDNFWSMGDTGPCGPCSEIFYDHGPDVAGGPPGSPEEEGDRYTEIWNLVFMQYNRDAAGNMTPLPKPSIDTGMGLERLAAVLQGVHSNYETDLFQALIQAAAKEVGCKDLANKSLRVIADHIRSVSFLIAEGVLPSNEGRGYVLRRILRRAARHGHQLGCERPFLHNLVASLVDLMGDAYPVLRDKQAAIAKAIEQEEQKFHETLSQGIRLFESAVAGVKDAVNGETIFKLYDTYGFPADLTADLARERGLECDMAGFEQCMQAQRDRARAASQFKVDLSKHSGVDISTDFIGYDHLTGQGTIKQLFDEKGRVNVLKAGQAGEVILPITPFYAESGGQVGDAGTLSTANATFDVLDTQKTANAFIHIGQVKSGEFKVGEKVDAKVDAKRRQATVLNHSATHLLHAALREKLGTHVEQKGSLVAPERLRFDFSHNQALTALELKDIEARVNEKIWQNTAANVTETTPDIAKSMGAMALFGEKYGDTVRVLEMGAGYSVELCGGTHVSHTGDIGLFVITMETGVAAGVRRIEAITGAQAFAYLRGCSQQLNQMGNVLRTDADNVSDKVSQLLQQNKKLEKDVAQLKQKMATGGSQDAANIKTVGEFKLLIQKLEGIEPKLLRSMVDDLKSKIGQGIVVLAAVNEGKVQLIVGVTKACAEKLGANEVVNFISPKIGGKGGGRKDMAQAGGSEVNDLDSALDEAEKWIQERIL